MAIQNRMLDKLICFQALWKIAFPALLSIHAAQVHASCDNDGTMIQNGKMTNYERTSMIHDFMHRWWKTTITHSSFHFSRIFYQHIFQVTQFPFISYQKWLIAYFFAHKMSFSQFNYHEPKDVHSPLRWRKLHSFNGFKCSNCSRFTRQRIMSVLLIHVACVLNAFYSGPGMLNKSLFCHFVEASENWSLHGVHCCWHGVFHVAIFAVSNKMFCKIRWMLFFFADSLLCTIFFFARNKCKQQAWKILLM